MFKNCKVMVFFDIPKRMFRNLNKNLFFPLDGFLDMSKKS